MGKSKSTPATAPVSGTVVTEESGINKQELRKSLVEKAKELGHTSPHTTKSAELVEFITAKLAGSKKVQKVRDPQLVKQITELAGQGMSRGEIGKKLGIDYTTVYTIVKGEGIQIQKVRTKNPHTEAIEKLTLQGRSVREIADELNLEYSEVYFVHSRVSKKAVSAVTETFGSINLEELDEMVEKEVTSSDLTD